MIYFRCVKRNTQETMNTPIPQAEYGAEGEKGHWQVGKGRPEEPGFFNSRLHGLSGGGQRNYGVCRTLRQELSLPSLSGDR